MNNPLKLTGEAREEKTLSRRLRGYSIPGSQCRLLDIAEPGRLLILGPAGGFSMAAEARIDPPAPVVL